MVNGNLGLFGPLNLNTSKEQSVGEAEEQEEEQEGHVQHKGQSSAHD